MSLHYILFCFGAGLVQGTWLKSNELNPLNTPIWWETENRKVFVFILAIISFLLELGIGFLFVSWWAGLFLWLPALLLSVLFVPGGPFGTKNPMIQLSLGIIIMIAELITFKF